VRDGGDGISSSATGTIYDIITIIYKQFFNIMVRLKALPVRVSRGPRGRLVSMRRPVGPTCSGGVPHHSLC